MTVKERVQALREKMKASGVAMYVVPSTDCHESEYVSEHFRARAFITGFTGSAGTAVIAQDDAGLWTDGRYFLQAEVQLQGTGIRLFRMGEPGAQEYYDSIVALYAQWGVDFIKCDDICNTNLYVEHPYSAAHEIEMLQHAIEKCGRDIVLSLSPGPALIEKAWHYETDASMWRITDDFWDTWELLYDMFRRCELWQNHVGCGSFPDCDMLPVGRLGKGFGQERQTNFTRDEQKTMMTLWCMFGSPLMIGGELTKLDDWTRFLLTRQELLQMLDADYVGRQVARDLRHAVWSCVNEKKDERYLALFNFMEQPARCEVALPETEAFADMCGQTGTIRARELWDGTELIVQNDSLSSEIPAHGVHVFRIDKK